MKHYTVGQLEAILGVGKWWSMSTASARLGNISQSDLRDTLFSLPRGVNGVFIEESKIFEGNEDFMMVGTLKDRIRRLRTWRTRLVFELRKPVVQDYPFMMRNTREKISQIDKTLDNLLQTIEDFGVDRDKVTATEPDRQELLESHDTLTDALEFLKYFSDSPEELDNRVQKLIEIVEREISKTKGEFQE